MSVAKHYIGKTFGKLTVVAFVGYRQSASGAKRPLARCRCCCGRVVVRDWHGLRQGQYLGRGSTCSACAAYRVQYGNNTSRARALWELEGSLYSLRDEQSLCDKTMAQLIKEFGPMRGIEWRRTVQWYGW